MRKHRTAIRKVFAAFVAMSILSVAYLGIFTNRVKADVYNQGVVDFVSSLYSDCLGRTPDPTGLNDWCSKLTSGQISGKECAYGFFFSPEFQTNANSMTDDEFIDAYYKVFLNRAADPSGKSYWISQIANTTNDISILFTGFADSVEFANKCASYGITAGPHINVPTTVRGASGGGSSGGAANTSLQGAAESAFAAMQAAANAHGWTVTESRVVRSTNTQYGIYYHVVTQNSPNGGAASVMAIIKAESTNNGITIYDSITPLGVSPYNIDYDNYSWNYQIDSPSQYYEQAFSLG